MRKSYLLVILLLIFIISACSSEDDHISPTDGNTKDDLQYKGSISGIVSDTNGKSLEGVSIVTIPEGYTSESDDEGKFTIPGVKGGDYSLKFSLIDYRDTILDSISLAIDQDLKGVNIQMIYDTNYVNKIKELLIVRDVEGKLFDSLLVKKVTVKAFTQDSLLTSEKVASWNLKAGTFTSTLSVAEKGGYFEIFATDEQNKVTGFTIYQYDSSNNQVSVSPFSAENAIPHGFIANSDSSEVNDIVNVEKKLDFIAVVEDEYGKIASYEWDSGDGVFHKGSSKFTLDVISVSSFTIRCRVTDDEGQKVVLSESFTLDNEQSKFTALTPRVSTPSDSVEYSLNISDREGIKEVVWFLPDGTKKVTKHSGESISSSIKYLTPDIDSITVGNRINYPVEYFIVDNFDDTVKGKVIDTCANDTPKLAYHVKSDGGDNFLLEEGDTVRIYFDSIFDYGKTRINLEQGGDTILYNIQSDTFYISLDPKYAMYLNISDDDGNYSSYGILEGSFPVTGTFIDSRDGHEYQWIQIKNQVWMAENLAYLPNLMGLFHGSEINDTLRAYYVYDENRSSKLSLEEDIQRVKLTENYKNYGVLYNRNAMYDWNTAKTVTSKYRGVCPEGWYLPNKNDWNTLYNNVGQNAVSIKSQNFWEDGTPGENTVFFDARAGGKRKELSSGNDAFIYQGKDGYFWSADSANQDRAKHLSDQLIDFTGSVHSAYSVRCLRK